MQQWVLLEGFPSIFPDLLPPVDIHVTVLAEAVRQGLEQDIDLVLCDTSGRLHTNYNLMEELRSCKRAVTKALPSAPNEVLLVLDGTTGLNMLPQAREFNQVIGVTGFVLTKLDGTSRGGCVVGIFSN
jgi:fused signal recognition particle receptor